MQLSFFQYNSLRLTEKIKLGRPKAGKDKDTQGSSRDQAATADMEGKMQKLTAIIFCLLAPSLRELWPLLASAVASELQTVAACGCTGCHSVHGQARSTQKGSLSRGQHECARKFSRICTPTSALPSLRLQPDTWLHHLLARIWFKKSSQNQLILQ